MPATAQGKSNNTMGFCMNDVSQSISQLCTYVDTATVRMVGWPNGVTYCDLQEWHM